MQHKAILAKAAIAGLIAVGSATTALAGDVGVAVNINAPGVYGQITIGGGGLPPPELLLPRPTVVVAAPVVVGVAPPEPLYLHVPPGHEKHWAKHCREYNACDRPVYFVSDRWYNDVYTPRRHEYENRQEEHEHHFDREHEHEHGRDHDRDHDHHDHDRDHDRGDRDHDH